MSLTFPDRDEYRAKVESVISRTGDAADLPATAPIVAMFATGYMPGDPNEESGENMTSFEIMQRLEDIAAVSTTDIALTMTYLGYRLHFNLYGSPEWAMRPWSAE